MVIIYKSAECFIKGFIEDAKVQFNDDKWIELPRPCGNYKKIGLHKYCKPRSEGTSF